MLPHGHAYHDPRPGALAARPSPRCQLGPPARRPLLRLLPARQHLRRCQGPPMLQHSRNAGSNRPQSHGLQQHLSCSIWHSRHDGLQARSFLHQSHSSSGSQCAQSRLTGWLPRRRPSLHHHGETPPRLQQHSPASQLVQLLHSSACKRARAPPAMARQQEAEAAAHPAPRHPRRSQRQSARVTSQQQQQRGRPTSRAAGSSGRPRRRQPPHPLPSGHLQDQTQQDVPLLQLAAKRRLEALPL